MKEFYAWVFNIYCFVVHLIACSEKKQTNRNMSEGNQIPIWFGLCNRINRCESDLRSTWNVYFGSEVISVHMGMWEQLFWCTTVAFTLIRRNTQHRGGCDVTWHDVTWRDAKTFWSPRQLTAHRFQTSFLEVSEVFMNSLWKHVH